jgi:hypothetical protein
MPSIEQIIKSGDLILDKAPDKLVNSTRLIEILIYKALLELFENIDITNGKLSSTPKAEDFLASLDYRIFRAMRDSGYGNSVNEYITNFDKITDNLQDLHQKLGNGIIPKSDLNAIKRIETQNTIQNLTEKGLYKDVIAPLRKDLYRNIMFGASLESTQEMVRNYILSTEGKDSRLLRYVKQISTDALHQYDGSVNQMAKDKLGLNAVRYVGSLIEDSRAQCIKWVEKDIITDDELPKEIEFAINKEFYKGKKCSGMIPGTKNENFCINRGGWVCRHRAIPIRVK